MNRREFYICDIFFLLSFGEILSFRVKEVSWVKREKEENKNKSLTAFLSNDIEIFFWIICLHKTAISMCFSSVSSPGVGRSAARPRLRIMLHSRNYFRFPQRRETENGSGSELYQSCQTPSHDNTGPRLLLHWRLLWLLDSEIGD